MKEIIKKDELICLLIVNFPDYKAGNIQMLFQDLIQANINKSTLLHTTKCIKKYLPVIKKYVAEPTSVNIVKYGLDCFYQTGWNGNEPSESRMKVIFEILKQYLAGKYNTNKISEHANNKRVKYPSWLVNERKSLYYFQASDFSLERCIIKKLVSIQILESVYKV